MSRATEAQLDALHGLLAGALAEELEEAIRRSRLPVIKGYKAGEHPDFPHGREGQKPEPINPQLLDKVMKFLGQNGVDSPVQSERKDKLAGVLQDLDLDAEAQRGPARH